MLTLIDKFTMDESRIDAMIALWMRATGYAREKAANRSGPLF
jgi:hypothetical protein